MTTIQNIQPKARKSYQGIETTNTYNADIDCGNSIRIYGTYRNHVNGPQQFDRTFKVGDEAEYDSYNLKYTGKIVAIGEKTVSICAKGTGERIKRLDLHTFCWRNWDFDAAQVAAYNAEERLHI